MVKIQEGQGIIMPYSVNNPPDKIKSLPANKQKQWVEVFNSCFKEHKDDEKCHKMAWGVVKKASEEIEHNDKYRTDSSCNCCAVSSELLLVALDLGHIEPKISSELVSEVEEIEEELNEK